MFSRLKHHTSIHFTVILYNLTALATTGFGFSCGTNGDKSAETTGTDDSLVALDTTSADTHSASDALPLDAILDAILDDGGVAQSDLDVCEPDCTGKQCGNDGCGGNCGVCDQGMKCVTNQCEPLCLPNTDTVCQGKSVYWVNSCQELGIIKETCSTGTECEDGTCVPCRARHSKTCNNNDVVWQNSCGELGAVIETCRSPLVCVKGSCAEPFSPFSGSYNIVTIPESKAVTLGKNIVTATFPAKTATIEIDASSEATLEFTGGNVSFSAVGALTGENKLDAGGTFTEVSDGVTIVHEFTLSVLFQNQTTFAGTVKDLIFEEEKTGAPTVIVRDVTGTRIP